MPFLKRRSRASVFNVQEVYESWLEEITRLDLGQSGKEQEARHFEHIKKGLLKVLENDDAIRQDVWNDQFTKSRAH